MTGDSPDDPVVLVVEDERNLADLFAQWLSSEFDVLTAYDGDEALDEMDDTVDVVLLDRRMPGLSGDEFLQRIREDGYDCQVAVVTAVDPDFDVLEMGFDEYVEKPVDREALIDTVDKLLARGLPDPDIREYFSLVSKRDALEEEMTREELAGNRDYSDLLAQIDELRTQIVLLAEASIQDGVGSVDPDRKRVFQETIETWEERKRTVDESDPLYDVADAQIKKYRNRLQGNAGDPEGATRKFLEMVAAGFTAEDPWLDEPVLRAINQHLFNKFSDTLVINRRRISEGTDLDEGDLYEVSSKIRELAREALEGQQ